MGRRLPDGWLVLMVFGLVAFGLIMVYSASFPKALHTKADQPVGDNWRFLRQQVVYALIGFVIMLRISRLHPETIRRLSLPLLYVTLTLTFITITGASVARSSHGAPRWLGHGSFQVQPSEFAKLALILYIAAKLSEGRLNRENFRRLTVRLGLALGVLVVLLLKQKDQGMTVLIGLIALVMAYLGHARGRWLAAFVVIAIAVTILGVQSEHYRTQRIRAYRNPLQYRTESGWQILMMKITIARGGLTGLGPGMCKEKYKDLPEAHTDAIFCVVASEYGLLGALTLLIVMGLVISRIVAIAVLSPSNLGYFMAAGVAVMLAIQTLINVGVATHLIPITGMTLPFVSYGGSSLVTSLAAIGVVLSVQRHTSPVRVTR
jgi:cell division protein FtsW